MPSGVREVSPHFVKYWKYHKTHLKEKGFVDYENDFYQFTGLMPEYGQNKLGSGLVKMLHFSKESGFYRASDDTLLTWMSFAKEK